MINYNPKHGDMEMWMICTAIGEKHDLIDKMKKNEDGSYPVVFSVGGIELDFNRVAKRLEEQISELVRNRAEALLDEKYGSLIGEIMDIQERIKDQKESLFKYECNSLESRILLKERRKIIWQF